VLVLYALCGLFTLTALGLNFANSAQSAMLLVGMGVVIFVLMRKLGYLDLHRAGAVGEARRKNIRLRSVVKELSRMIRAATSLQALWDAVRPLAEALEVARMELRLQRQRDGLTDGVVFETQRPAGSSLPLDMRVEVKEAEVSLGWLSLSWRDGRTQMSRDEELAVELVADAVAERAASLMALAEADPERVVALRR
jgi:UDP-GlcNAc:undecaprenyl-phosphate GlcNAc-1-phosphate transferase